MKKTKKIAKRLCALGLAMIMGLSMVGCGEKTSKGDSAGEKIDNERTQLYVHNFGGGFGTEWLYAAKKRYEELHKDDVYEEGKKGIQIVINEVRETGDSIASKILGDKEEVYFSEYVYYYSYLSQGLLADITEAVTKDMSAYGDAKGTTIESKMTDEQKEFYGVEENGKTHYYAIPHYMATSGIVYNVDLFEQEGYYFADGVTDAEELEDYFIVRKTDRKSTGPDGLYDTYDDGLPATFDEFFLLCDYIAKNNQTPVSWHGTSSQYLTEVLSALETNLNTREQTNLNYSMNGVAEGLGTATDSGFVADSGNKTITAENGYELYRRNNKYYALDFLYKLTTTDKYHNQLAFNKAYSYVNKQEDFLYAGYDGGKTAPIAMMVEGNWWEEEAKDLFRAMETSMGEKFSRENRRFAMLPMPKLNEESLGKNAILDKNYSVCFMKGNIEEWKKPIALDFIAFVNSDESLVEFTQVTNQPKGLQYTMTEEQMEKMSYFGKSVQIMKQNSDVLYPFSKEDIYINQAGKFAVSNMWTAIVNSSTYKNPADVFNEGKATAAEYFSGMLENYKKTWNLYVY